MQWGKVSNVNDCIASLWWPSFTFSTYDCVCCCHRPSSGVMHLVVWIHQCVSRLFLNALLLEVFDGAVQSVLCSAHCRLGMEYRLLVTNIWYKYLDKKPIYRTTLHFANMGQYRQKLNFGLQYLRTTLEPMYHPTIFVLELEWSTRVLGYPRVHVRLASPSPDKRTPLGSAPSDWRVPGYPRVH